MALLEVQHLKKYYPVYSGTLQKRKQYVKAVNDVSFSIDEGKTFGLVGESGCGKTTVGKSILRLIEPTGGNVVLDGREIINMNNYDLRRERKNMQIIFQDPYSSLNPQMTIERIINEPLKEFHLVKDRQYRERVGEIMETVGLAHQDMSKYPHEFSGGQRQRIMIARALSVDPKIIICDEPVSALDVSVQAQILNLMQDLQNKFGVSFLFIAHGMPVVRHISHNVGVMYLGSLVETGDSEEIFNHCLHPYTKALISAIPAPNPDHNKKRILLEGEVPSLTNLPRGCLFSSRCSKSKPICKECIPILKEVAPKHYVACHFLD